MNTNFRISPSTRLPRRSGAAERRRDARQDFSADAEVVEEVSGTRLYMNARVEDLSLGGCYLDTINPFAPETRAYLRIQYRNMRFACLATVKSAQLGMGMGLAFEELNQAQTDLLNSWLDESNLSTAPPSDPADPWVGNAPAHTVTPQVESSTSTLATKGAVQAPAGSQSGPQLQANGQKNSQTDDCQLSLRLAKLLFRKGLIDECEMGELLNKGIL